MAGTSVGGAAVALLLLGGLVSVESADLLAEIAQKKMDDLVQLVTAIEKGFVQLTMRDCTGIKTFLGMNYDQLKAAGKPDLSVIVVSLHSGSEVVKFNFTSDLSTRIMSHSLYNRNLPLMVFTPGFMATSSSPITRIMSSRLAATRAYNVLALDPSQVLGWFYYYSASVVRFIGEALGRVLADFYNGGTTKYYLIGHSLGAHISGFAGKTFYNLTGVKIDRITGLDAAGPCFFDESKSLKLNSTDAKFVDVIHTDTGTFGIIEPCGHVDFYPNGGESQPNCLSFMCSHNKSWEFFSESITRPRAFPSVRCPSWYLFRTGACATHPRVHMGYSVSATARGTHYLKTDATSLYGIGEEGITTPDTVDLATKIQIWWTNFLGSLGIKV